MRLKSDLFMLLDHAVAGRSTRSEASWDRRVALGVVLAAANYPGTPHMGDVISGLPKGGASSEDSPCFHAGTSEREGQTVTAGGRVLCVTALGDNVKQAQKRPTSDYRNSLRRYAVSPRHRPPRRATMRSQSRQGIWLGSAGEPSK